MSQTNLYPTTPFSTWTSEVGWPNTTLAAENASLELYDNSEIELYSIARSHSPFLTTLISLWRDANNKNFDDIWLTETSSNNFPDIKWKEEDEPNINFEMSATWVNSSATTLVLDSTAWLVAWHMLRVVSTNENLRVASVTNATDVVVQRAVGTVAAQAIAAEAKLQVIWFSSTEWEATVGTYWVEALDKFNYFQKFLTTIVETDFDTLKNKVKGRDKTVNKKLKQHMKDIEMAMLFGQKKSGQDSNWDAYYTMEWLIPTVANGWATDDISSTLTMNTLEEAFSKTLRYWSDTKIALCWSKARRAIAELFENRLQTGQIKEVDLTFDKLTVDNGTFIFMSHPFLDEYSGYDGHVLVLDPAWIEIVYPTAKSELDWTVKHGKTVFNIDNSKSNNNKKTGSFATFLSVKATNLNSMWLFKVV